MAKPAGLKPSSGLPWRLRLDCFPRLGAWVAMTRERRRRHGEAVRLKPSSGAVLGAGLLPRLGAGVAMTRERRRRHGEARRAEAIRRHGVAGLDCFPRLGAGVAMTRERRRRHGEAVRLKPSSGLPWRLRLDCFPRLGAGVAMTRERRRRHGEARRAEAIQQRARRFGAGLRRLARDGGRTKKRPP